MPGTTILEAEVTNISGHCVWMLIDDEELALPYSDAWEAVDDEVQAQASQFGLGYSIQPFTITWSSVSEAVIVPGPTPIAGGAMAFTFSRRIRKRIRRATYKHSHR